MRLEAAQEAQILPEMNGYKRRVLHFMKVGEADPKLISACSRNVWKWKRLPLSGSRRIFWRDGGEDAVRGLLYVLKALQKQFGISAVKSDIIPRGGTGFESDG